MNSYPGGAYVEEARMRLDACLGVAVEAPGPVDERHYSQWHVNASPRHAFATEDEARADARKRGSEDAAETCASFGMKDRVVSASIEPGTWECTEHEHRWVCGFTGDLVCRVQRMVSTPEERCNEPASSAAAR